MLQVFETKRMLFRPFVWDDLDDLYKLYSSKKVMRYVSVPRTYEETRQRLAKHINDRKTFGFGLLAAIWKLDNSFIGRCGLDPVIYSGEVQGDLAWMFLPEHWGKGLATEFGQQMIEIGFCDLGLKRIFATAHRDNLASIRVMEKLSMTYVSRQEQRLEYEIILQ